MTMKIHSACVTVFLLTLAAVAAERSLLTTSRVIGTPDAPPPYRAARVFPNLKFDRPIWVRAEPGTQNLWVCEHHSGYGGPGLIFRMKDAPDAKPEKIFETDWIIYG